VMDEVSYALEEGKLIVPILLRSCAIPFRLRRVQHIDFTASYDAGFSQLLRALRIDQPSYPLELVALKEPASMLPSESESGTLGLSRPLGDYLRVIEKVGPRNPETEGFKVYHDVLSTVVYNQKKTGYEAWQLSTKHMGYYSHPLTQVQKEAAYRKGWRLSM